MVRRYAGLEVIMYAIMQVPREAGRNWYPGTQVRSYGGTQVRRNASTLARREEEMQGSR